MTKDNAKAPEQAVDQQQVLRDLLALGRKNGRLSLKEIADALGQLELESEDIDKLYDGRIHEVRRSHFFHVSFNSVRQCLL